MGLHRPAGACGDIELKNLQMGHALSGFKAQWVRVPETF
jgi:hypothetical protein